MPGFKDLKVTWLLPVKNGMPYLREALASIENQTFRDWEVLAWDNGSTDETVDELHRWIPSRLPGRVITDEPLPLGDSLARMVELSETEFCARIDADDINFPERLERQISFLRDHDEIAMVGSQAIYINDAGTVFARSQLPLDFVEIVASLPWTNRILHPSVVFRRSAVLRVGNYRKIGPPGINIEDYDLWFRLAVTNEFCNLDLPLLYYRFHDKSTTHIATVAGRLRAPSNQCFLEHADDLYGLSRREAIRLLRISRFNMVYAIYKITRIMARKQNRPFLPLFRSRSLTTMGRDYAGLPDVFSRFSLALLDGRRSVFREEMRRVAVEVLKLCGLSPVASAVRDILRPSERRGKAEEGARGQLQSPATAGLEPDDRL